MIDINSFMSSLDNNPTAGGTDDSLKQKLSLYQVFLRLYEQHRTLLDEILTLENSNGEHLLRAAAAPYVYGFVMNGQAGIVTNLMKGETQTIFQSQHIWTIGRDRRKSVIPIADERLSRCHAAIVYNHQVQSFYLVDFDSTNGSFVNGEQIRHQHPLRDGDRVRLASLSFSFSLSHSIRTARRVAPDIEALVRDRLQRLGIEAEPTAPEVVEKLTHEASHQESLPAEVDQPKPKDQSDPSADGGVASDSEASPDADIVVDDTLMFLRDTL